MLKKKDLLEVGYRSIGFNLDNQEAILKVFGESVTLILLDEHEKVDQLIRLTHDQINNMFIKG